MKAKNIILILLPALLLAACAPKATPAPTVDVSALSTAAAETVVANITNTALAQPPTPQPTATEAPATDTPTPTVSVAITFGPGTSGPLCEVYKFISDVNYPDNSEVTAGSDFTKTWKIQNVGTCAWSVGYKVAYAGYTDKMNGVPQAITTVVQPGQQVDVSVQFKAPTKPGVYVSAWTLANALGINFFDDRGKPFYVKVVVR